MITAEKRPRFSAWLARHAERRLGRTFDQVLVAGAASIAEVARTRPLLIVANHSAWWDAMMVLVLSERVLRVDGHALMDAANLRRHRFFALTGAIGIDLGDPRDGARAILHCTRLLDRPGRALWIFAQGDERPLHEDLAFRPGSTRIAALAPSAAVVPLALAYGFGAAPEPTAFASFGPPLETDARNRLEAQRAAVARQLDRIRTRQSGGSSENFVPLVTRRSSRMRTWASASLDRIAGFLLQQAAGADPKRALPPPHAPRTQGSHDGAQQ
jgi:1-acyl-sn-glycerol-3-phosphate acyltransferase